MDRDENEVKSWRCKRGHTMGLVVRQNRVRRLLLLREALEIASSWEDRPALAMTDELDVMAVVEGYVADVKCSICGEVRTWVPGEEALRRLLKQAGVRGQG
jgi:hypothetical protein